MNTSTRTRARTHNLLDHLALPFKFLFLRQALRAQSLALLPQGVLGALARLLCLARLPQLAHTVALSHHQRPPQLLVDVKLVLLFFHLDHVLALPHGRVEAAGQTALR